MFRAFGHPDAPKEPSPRRVEAEKGNKFRMLPMAPEFHESLERMPKHQRRGHVFSPLSRRPGIGRLTLGVVSKTICDIGKAAGIKVSERTKRDKKTGKAIQVVKYASAHNFRRAFGFRWAMRVLPPALIALMRHESIQTTLEFYVGRNADAVADDVWRAFTAISTATTESGANSGEFRNANTP